MNCRDQLRTQLVVYIRGTQKLPNTRDQLLEPAVVVAVAWRGEARLALEDQVRITLGTMPVATTAWGANQ